MTVYEIGDKIRCYAEFRTLAGVLTDPDVVTFKHKDPSANVATITYDPPGDIVRTAAGLYYYDLAFDEGGKWSIKWQGVGTVDAAAEKSLTVRASAF